MPQAISINIHEESDPKTHQYDIRISINEGSQNTDLNYNLFIHLVLLFTSCSISTWYKLHLLRVCLGCPQTEQTLGRLHLGSLFGSGADVLDPISRSMLVQLCPTCLQLEQTWWRRLPFSPVEGILVARGWPVCFRKIGGLTTTNLMDSEKSHSSGW